MRRAAWIVAVSLTFGAPGFAQEPEAPSAENAAGAEAQRPEEARPSSAAENTAPESPAAESPAAESPAAENEAGEALPAGHPPVAAPAGEAAAGAEGEALPAGHPPVAGAAPAGHAGLAGVLGEPDLGSAEPSDELPAGTIRVTVVDAEGRPVPDAAVDIGVRSQIDERSRHNERTDASGRVIVRDLPTGLAQAYRVNVPHLGATFSSSPFQLPTDRGYDVRITRLPVTRDDRFVFFHLFRVVFELRDERLHIIHQAELTNAGRETFVFPDDGLRAALPEGATAFQAQAVMTDQRIVQVGDSYALRGSVPPGTTRLAWAYDIPVSGEMMRIPVEVPLRFFGMQVFSEAPEGLVMDVSGMPDPQRINNQGQAIWLTQVRRGPTDPSLDRITVTISGIPGPGPMRWIAVGIALLFLLGGVVLRMARSDDRAANDRARARRRDDLLDEIRALEEELEAGEVGPEFRQTRRAEIVRELASLLHEEEAARAKDTAPRGKPGAQPARSSR